jgi:hypothetical protein
LFGNWIEHAEESAAAGLPAPQGGKAEEESNCHSADPVT